MSGFSHVYHHCHKTNTDKRNVTVIIIFMLCISSFDSMGRSYIVEDDVEGYLSKLCSQQADTVTGLIIGQVSLTLIQMFSGTYVGFVSC